MDRSGVRGAIHALDQSGLFQAPEGELSVVFLDNERMATLHADYLGECTATDVITFPGDPEMEFAGEICVSAEMAREFARGRGLPFSRELMLYLVHGYLHLSGFDDREALDRRQMRRAEKKAMRLLEESRTIADFALR